MKRRNFLLGLGAVITTAPLLVKYGTLPAHSAVKASPLTLYPSKLKQYLIVMNKGRDAHRVWQLMGCPDNVKVIGIGSMLCGYRADMVVYDDYEQDPYCKSEVLEERAKDWFNQCVHTRLVPDGKMFNVQYMTRGFDFNQQCGFGMEFRGDDYGPIVRNAVRIRKMPEVVTHDDRLQAKALMYSWFIRKHG